MNRPSHESIWIVVIENLYVSYRTRYAKHFEISLAPYRDTTVAIIPMKLENVEASIEITFDLLDRI